MKSRGKQETGLARLWELPVITVSYRGIFGLRSMRYL